MKTTNEVIQHELAQKSNKILEEIIDIEDDVLVEDEERCYSKRFYTTMAYRCFRKSSA